jgi:hypothetical protein
MVDDVTPSNLPVVLVKEKELEEAPFDMNVVQRSHEEELCRKVLRM